jgi:hypothetical protein
MQDLVSLEWYFRTTTSSRSRLAVFQLANGFHGEKQTGAENILLFLLRVLGRSVRL